MNGADANAVAIIAQAWSDAFQQHNLLSTTPDAERRAFIARNIGTYNALACPVLESAQADDSGPEPSDEDLTACQNCGTVRPEGELNPFEFHPERVAPGEPLPVGDCPDCGSRICSQELNESPCKG
jgi:hypothetical protein